VPNLTFFFLTFITAPATASLAFAGATTCAIDGGGGISVSCCMLSAPWDVLSRKIGLLQKMALREGPRNRFFYFSGIYFFIFREYIFLFFGNIFFYFSGIIFLFFGNGSWRRATFGYISPDESLKHKVNVRHVSWCFCD
jgi:hypothetical protein